jgi:hypothetical protein
VAVVAEPVAAVVSEPVAEEQEELPRSIIKDKTYHRQKYQEVAAILQEYVHRLISESNQDDFDKNNGDELLAFALDITS